jgi:hypothetical protein
MHRGFARRLAGPLLAAGLLLAPALAVQAMSEVQVLTSQPAGSGWVVNKTDNICGLDDARMLSHPAKVNYSRLLQATPEMKKIRNEGIDPSSAKGSQLRKAAVDRVRKACNTVSQSNGHCSVWKNVRHRDGRAVSDITSDVLRLL